MQEVTEEERDALAAICMEMIELAVDKIKEKLGDKIGADLELILYSLFNHGFEAQKIILDEVYSIKPEDLERR